MKNRIGIKRMALIMVMALILQVFAYSGAIRTMAVTDISMDDFEDTISTYNIDDSILSYNDYRAAHASDAVPDRTVIIGADAVVRYEESGAAAEAKLIPAGDPEVGAGEHNSGSSILTTEDSLVEFEVNIPETGMYNMSLEYFPTAGKNSDIERAIFIDGELPFKEMSLVTFSRVWTARGERVTGANGTTAYTWEKDNQGNDVKPGMIEAPEWQTRYVYDSDGYITTPLAVYLTAGDHTVTFVSIKEPVIIGSVIFDNAKTASSYAEVKSALDAAGAKDTSGKQILIEAENLTKASSQMLYPQQDQSSPEVVPASSKTLLNNTVGGNSWRLVGQWLEWQFDVPETGYYEITMHDKQNFSRGVAVSRRISIDGAVPFSELDNYEFGYSQNWKIETLSDESGEPFRFYLDAGSHTIRMEVVLGDFSTIVGMVEDAVQRLNDIYRRVIKITGVSPDRYRDYQIESSLPELTGDLIATRDILNAAIERLDIVAGKNSDKKTVLLTMRDQLDDLIKDNDDFVKVISSYKVNVRACGNWITQVISQPLALDSFSIHSADTKSGISKSNFFTRAGHEISRLFYSFVIDYNQIGSVAEDKDAKVITLWIGSGRDQANVIKSLIDETFTNKNGISVNVQLVDMSTLLKATLVGEGPDVAIQVANTNGIAGAVLNTGNDTPVNYGIRHAVLDLTRFPDWQEVLTRFPDAAYEQFMYNGALYALPETITFPVMFYRKDILKEIGLELPTTWDDVKVAMSVLSKNQMEFGMLPNEQLFASMLYQHGGKYYTEDSKASALDSDIAVNAFKVFCNYYTDYKIDRSTSVEERFRTGECPIIIADYTDYNNFAVSAPDIAGLWSFTQIPGMVQEDGSVDHSVACTGLASMIMADTDYPEESWAFIKWWSSAETQTAYGREMESLMGSAARVPTANYEAFTNMSWPVSDFRALQESMQCVRGIPQVPGGYYSWRNVNNAFYTVVTETDTASPREELMDKVIYINAEIDYKRAELGLD
ncbi:MAG: extracellular solute-binding protein [Lachnospiraceae bacterium]|nr:extracellular solute-binding protein [Lachnospiraceae bacterium]